jgi:2'-5' RNA ligase
MATDDAIRAFLAITLPEGVLREVDAVEREVQRRAGEGARRAVRWVVTSNLHLTLKFLGEASTANLNALSRVVEAITARHAPFSFTVVGLGAFPNTRRPRVIWVGAEAPPDLQELARAIEGETRRLGYPAEERPFTPHLTLGRISQNARPDEVNMVAKALGEMKVGSLGKVQVDALHLYRSELRPGGSVYTPLQVFKLGG